MQADLELEAGCLSALSNLAAVDLEAARQALDEAGAQAQDFADDRMRAVWAVIEAMVRDGRVPDVITVSAKVPSVTRKFLSDVMLRDSVVAAPDRLRTLRELGMRRRSWRALEAAKSLLADNSQALSHIAAEARKAVDALESSTPAIATLDGELFAFLDHLEEVSSGRRPATLESGIAGLDAIIGGLQPTLTILGALPGVGKSALLAGIVRNLSARGVPLGFFSLEDERQWLVRRLVAEASQIPVFVLANRPLFEPQQKRLAACTEAIHKQLRHVVVDDRPGLTAPDIVASAREMLTKHRVRALFVDHLGEVRLQRTDRHDLDIADALSQLRALAKTYRVPVVVACHVRRREGLLAHDEPRLTDFAFSAAVERMARVALALSRPKENPDLLRVHVLKQTQGQAGVSVDLELESAAGIVANAAAPGIRNAMDKEYRDQEEAMRNGD